MIKRLCGTLSFVLAACSPEQPSPDTSAPKSAFTPAKQGMTTLALSWRLGGLSNPESAALSADGTFLYVTNVNGDAGAKDGNGFISRVSTDGRMLERDWSKGFDGPKGIVRSGTTLHIADIDQLVSVNALTGAIESRTPLPAAVFANDAAMAPDGSVLVADSGASKIYAVVAGKADTWLGDKLLDSVNGLLPESDRLVVTTMAGRLLAIDYQTKAITVLGEGLGDADGLAALGGGRYLVSEWPGLMHVVLADGSHQTILDTRQEKRLLNDFVLVGDTLYQPNWDPGEITAYRVVSGAP